MIILSKLVIKLPVFFLLPWAYMCVLYQLLTALELRFEGSNPARGIYMCPHLSV
jgi:hypothetical protein